MIPIDAITQWKSHTPWSFQTQIEQELVLSRALIHLFQQSTIQSSLAFRGGTALNKRYCQSTARYSEDIDLVQTTQAPTGEIMTSIRQALSPMQGRTQWKQHERSVKLAYRFQSKDKPTIPLRLKIEINTGKFSHSFGLQEKPFAADSPWFCGKTTVTTYQLEELMGTKLRALYQR